MLMDILRFITAGSVDDGKSTLIGRLLYDSKSILIDHLDAIQKQSKNKDNGEIDLALLTDGLRAEREQGITIDVAYKYFSTPKRKFIIADAPGHIQYTRNMVTGASNSQLAIVLVDARKGVIEQTRRHSIIASLLNMPHVVVAINKMDLVNYDESIYNKIIEEYQLLAASLELHDVKYIPISALKGDNIVDPSENLPWYKGETLLHYLENVAISSDINLSLKRFYVQYVIRPQLPELHDYRGYAGRIISGIYRKGDKITIQPSGIETTISAIEIAGTEVEEAFATQSVVMHLADNVDVSRGDSFLESDNHTSPTQDIDALVCWMDNKPLLPGNRYHFQINSNVVKCEVKDIAYKLNINTLEEEPRPAKAVLNDVIKIRLRTMSPVSFDAYNLLRENGGAVIIDETSNVTVGACMIQ